MMLLRRSTHILPAFRAAPQRTAQLARRLATAGADDKPDKTTLLFESDQSFKFRALSAFGGVYTSCWAAYVAAEAFVLDPTGSIASNAGLVSLIGVSSVTVGAYVVRTLALRTVGRLEIAAPAAAPPLLRVTTYTPFGGERVDEAPLAAVAPRSDPGDDSRLKTFALPQDDQRSYLVLVDEPDAVKDAAAFARVVSGVAPFAEGDDDGRQHRGHRRRRRRRR